MQTPAGPIRTPQDRQPNPWPSWEALSVARPSNPQQTFTNPPVTIPSLKASYPDNPSGPVAEVGMEGEPDAPSWNDHTAADGQSR